ncbi:MAG: hypothetical protein HOE46_03370, partial [Candidatus Marinimicrobia bacterium]|nr:hypothetical protein [Candidatus Neomarinimicrobiota bacterium]
MSKEKPKKDPAELFVNEIKELSSSFTNSLDTFFIDIEKGVDRIFSNHSDNNSSKK